MIHVVDAIMGTGKTSAAISYINEHPNEKFIFVTPYLDEAARIKKGCPKMAFVEPSDKMKEFGFRKSAHTADLISRGRNITTTHQAFKGYTRDMLDDVRKMGYTLIIDENVDVLEKIEVHSGDVQMVVKAGYVKRDGDAYVLSDDSYSGRVMDDMFRILKARKLMCIDGPRGEELHYWALPPDLISSFKDVYVMTYLFECQSLHHFFHIHGFQYEKIGIERHADGSFHFGEYPGYTPEYVKDIASKIHILENERMNAVGDKHYALSVNWFNTHEDDVDQLRANVWNFFNHISKGSKVSERLGGTYKSSINAVKGKGFARRFIAFNTKATNQYRECNKLAYLTNIFMDVPTKNFYIANGIEVDEDMYALSIMVQWIWRSAIRDGKEIDLYLPSKRMRTILMKWMSDISRRGGELCDQEAM